MRLITTTGLRLRKGPSMRYATRLIMRKGTVVTRDRTQGGWSLITVMVGKTRFVGWAATRYLRAYIPADPSPKPTAGRLSGRSIVNDIGHGMGNRRKGVFDPGADPKGSPQEHAWAEAFVDELTKLERAEGASVTVIEDTPLNARKAVPAADATSWHFNAGGGHGVEVWVPWGASKASRARSDRIGRRIAAELGLPYRGTKRSAKLAVLNRGFDRLVELAFIDNAADRKAWLAKHASVAKAVVEEVAR